MTLNADRRWRINPYIEMTNETYADPRLTFTAAGVLATLHSKLRQGEGNLFAIADLPSPIETEQDILEALTLLTSLGYLMEK